MQISYVDAPKQTLHYLSWHHHLPKGMRECVGSVQLGQTLLLHARSPSPSALPILSCMCLHHFPSTFGAESSQFPETSLSLMSCFACVAPCARSLSCPKGGQKDRYGWLEMINGWNYAGSVTSDPRCKNPGLQGWP